MYNCILDPAQLLQDPAFMFEHVNTIPVLSFSIPDMTYDICKSQLLKLKNSNSFYGTVTCKRFTELPTVVQVHNEGMDILTEKTSH